jgi:cytochrome P450
MGLISTLAGGLARVSPRLAGVAARLAGNPFRYLAGKPLERQLLVYELPDTQLALANDLALVDTLLSDREGTFPKSVVLELLLRPLIGRGVFGQPGGDAVKQMRRIYVRALSRVPEPEVGRIARALTRQYLGAWHRAARPVPVPSELSRLTIDIVTLATLGACFTPGEGQRFVELFFEYHKRASPMLLLLGPRDLAGRQALVDRLGLGDIGCQMRALIRGRFLDPLLDDAAGARSAPFAAALLEAGNLPRRDGLGLAADAVRQEAMLDEIAVMLLAGHETTASVLSWLLWEVAARPRLQETSARLIAEQGTGGSGTLGAGPGAGQDRAQQWLAALIQESLRLYPPIAFLLRQTTQDVVFRERPIRAESFVVVSPWTIQRHRGLWQEPDTFAPERWMEAEPPPAMANRLAFIPFGQGPRVCPGKRFAEIEMYAILSELLGACRLSRTTGRSPQPLGSLTSRPDEDFRLLVVPLQRG